MSASQSYTHTDVSQVDQSPSHIGLADVDVVSVDEKVEEVHTKLNVHLDVGQVLMSRKAEHGTSSLDG